MSAAITLQRQGPNAEAIERAIVEGDLSALTPPQRVAYYKAVCESVGLNPLTKPFRYIRLNGALVLYATRDATDQIRSLRNVSLDLLDARIEDGIYVQKARATMPNGRTDASTGAVTIEGLKGEARANAIMKAETKAKRRVTLSICGLGMVDESELDAIPTAQRVAHDPETGEIRGELPAPAPDMGPGAAAAAAIVDPMVARFELRRAELIALKDLHAFHKLWKRIQADGKEARLSLDHGMQLRALADARKMALEDAAKAPQRAADERAMDLGDDPGGLGPDAHDAEPPPGVLDGER